MVLVIGFACNECAYAAADMAGILRLDHPAEVKIIRVPCSGLVDVTHILYALLLGADTVFVAGCKKGECHYIDGNYKAENRVLFLKEVLKALDIEPERVEMFFMSAAEPELFIKAAREMYERARRLGPMRLSRDKEEYRRIVDMIRKKTSLLGRDTLKKQIFREMLRALAPPKPPGRSYVVQRVPRGFAYPVITDTSRCRGCYACVSRCDTGALREKLENEMMGIYLDPSLCINCGECIRACEERGGGGSVIEYGVFDVIEFVYADELKLAEHKPLYCKICGKPITSEDAYSIVMSRLRSNQGIEIEPVCNACKRALALRSLTGSMLTGAETR